MAFWRFRAKPAAAAADLRREPGAGAATATPAAKTGATAAGAGKAARALGGLARRLARSLAPALTLLVWDVGALTVAVVRKTGRNWHVSALGVSTVADFALALDEALAALKQQGEKPPRKALLAARAIVPARVDLPVNPEKPRPKLQMREMTRAEMEPATAEFGALWNIGAVLAAHRLITPEARERIVLELAVRRNESETPGESRKPLYFGQLACEMGLIAPEALEEALRLQEKLQMLESWLACGWTGYAGEVGEPPVWLAAATGLALWNQCVSAAKSRRLKITGGLPLAWCVSENPDDIPGEAAPGRIALEIHSECIVAVLRHQGRVHSSRSESRMERPLSAELLIGLASDWRAGGAHELEIVCVNPEDEAAIAALLEEIEHRWGHAPRFRASEATRQTLLTTLARQHRNSRSALPVIRFGEISRPVWKKTGFWHFLMPLLTLAAIAGIAAQQQMEIRKIKTRFAENEAAEQKNARQRQELNRVFAEAQNIKKELTQARARLARIAPEVERRVTVEGMINRLPQLLRTLAANIGDDVVLEALHNSPNPSDMGNIRIIAWSSSYASAQTFAQTVQQALIGMGYSVAQTDVKAAPGRNKRPGYAVSFWLIPVAGQDELGAPD
jgi:hypothetical protein